SSRIRAIRTRHPVERRIGPCGPRSGRSGPSRIRLPGDNGLRRSPQGLSPHGPEASETVLRVLVFLPSYRPSPPRQDLATDRVGWTESSEPTVCASKFSGAIQRKWWAPKTAPTLLGHTFWSAVA